MNEFPPVHRRTVPTTSSSNKPCPLCGIREKRKIKEICLEVYVDGGIDIRIPSCYKLKCQLLANVVAELLAFRVWLRSKS